MDVEMSTAKFRTVITLIIAFHAVRRSGPVAGFLLFYRVEGMVIKNTTKPSPEQLRRGSAFDHIKCHRQVWNTWGARVTRC